MSIWATLHQRVNIRHIKHRADYRQCHLIECKYVVRITCGPIIDLWSEPRNHQMWSDVQFWANVSFWVRCPILGKCVILGQMSNFGQMCHFGSNVLNPTYLQRICAFAPSLPHTYTKRARFRVNCLGSNT
jgi:hypothetical protein